MEFVCPVHFMSVLQKTKRLAYRINAINIKSRSKMAIAETAVSDSFPVKTVRSVRNWLIILISAL